MAVSLAPLPQAIGIFDNFVAHQPETLVLKEKVLSLTGDSFSIKTQDGRPIFQIKGEVLSLSGRKLVTDMQGNHLFTIRKQHLTIPRTYYAESPSGERIFEVVSKFSVTSSKMYGKFRSSRGKDESLFMKGDFFDRQAEIKDESSAMTVATINRKFLNSGELLFGQQTYAVTIAPGMDMAVIVAMCVCLDEKRNEK